MTGMAPEDLAALRAAGTPRGLVSVCSAHELVLRAALRHGAEAECTVLIEATCNQVNHHGGYTGLTPDAFAALVARIAGEEKCPAGLVMLGGDHLGPNPWREQPAEVAMAEAEAMVAAYVAAGFTKIHLDCSMGCAGEPEALGDDMTAARATRLAAVAERTAQARGLAPPVYVIGTEVPPPGGADHALDHVTPTDPAAAARTVAVHRAAFAQAGLEDAFARVVALVVQPGVEFGNRNVIRYDRAAARDLSAALPGLSDPLGRLVFEAHSTDYQGEAALSELVTDGFAILKVGPELTFVLRETLYALDAIAADLVPGYGERPLKAAMEAEMLANPQVARRHYGEGEDAVWLRHYSLSDRIRYVWGHAGPREALARLRRALTGRRVPMPLLRQHLPDATDRADAPFDPDDCVIARIRTVLDAYHAACSDRA